MEFVNINKKPRPEFHCNKEIQGKLGQVFLVENLFNELKTKAQREKARKNLGINETVSWEDIINKPTTISSVYWSDLKGTPEVASPDKDDNSNRIATTAWVKDQIKNLSVAEPTEYLNINASPSSAFKGDGPREVTISWTTNKTIISQAINGEELDPEVRQYKTTVTDSKVFTLSYTTENGAETASCSIQYIYPTYYGTYPDYSELSKTSGTTLNIDVRDGMYAYVFLPNKPNAKFYIGGFEGGFELIDTLDIHGMTYYKFKSENPSLGSILIEIK